MSAAKVGFGTPAQGVQKVDVLGRPIRPLQKVKETDPRRRGSSGVPSVFAQVKERDGASLPFAPGGESVGVSLPSTRPVLGRERPSPLAETLTQGGN